MVGILPQEMYPYTLPFLLPALYTVTIHFHGKFNGPTDQTDFIKVEIWFLL
jgi:hypothetical protein